MHALLADKLGLASVCFTTFALLGTYVSADATAECES